MAKNAPSLTRIYQIGFGLAFLFICYGAVRTMMVGAMTNVKQIAFFSIAFAVVMLLDAKYWLLLPLCMALGIKVPGIPFNSTELGCIALSGMYMVRTCMHRDPAQGWNKSVMAAFPLFFWMCLFWAINPPGLNILHSDSIGMRFYLRILFAFWAMCCLAAMNLKEADCRLLFWVLVAGAMLSILLNLIGPGLRDIDSSERVLSRYYLLAFSTFYFLIWAQFPLPVIFTTPKLLAITTISALAMVISGKRSVSASVALIPIYRCLMTRRHIVITMVFGLIALLILSIAVTMDGTFIEIPSSAKRSLAMVFPKYRDRMHQGLHDTFREEVHAGAKQLIRAHPWVGRKGFRMDMTTSIWLYGMGVDTRREGHIFAGNWHGAFWAFAADFGIPCLLFYLFFVWRSLSFTFHYARQIPLGSARSACFLFYGMQLLHSSVIMFTSGHSSITSEQCMLYFGMLVAIANGFHSDAFTSNDRNQLAQ